MRRQLFIAGLVAGVLLAPAKSWATEWWWRADRDYKTAEGFPCFVDAVHVYSEYVNNWEWKWDDPFPGMVSLRDGGSDGRGFMFSDSPGWGEDLSVDTGITVAVRVKPVVLSGGGSLVISVENSSTADVVPDGSTHLWVGWDDRGSTNGDVVFHSRSGTEIRTFEASVSIRNQWTIWTYAAKQIGDTMAWDLWIDGVAQAQDQAAPDSSLHTVVWSDSTDMGTSIDIGQRRWQGDAHDTAWDWVAVRNDGVIPGWMPTEVGLWVWQADNHDDVTERSYFEDGVNYYDYAERDFWQWYWNDPNVGVVSLRGNTGRARAYSSDFGEAFNVDKGVTVAARVKPVVLSGGGSLVISVDNSSTWNSLPDGSAHMWIGWDNLGSSNGDVTCNSRSGTTIRSFPASVNIRNEWTVWTYTAKRIGTEMAWDLWINGVPQAQDQPAALDGSLHTVVWNDSTDMGTSVNIGQRRYQGGSHETVWAGSPSPISG